MKIKKYFIIALAILIIGSLWIVRFKSLNLYWQTTKPRGAKTTIYQIGDTVEFEKNSITKGSTAEGCTICVENCQFVNYLTYLEENNIVSPYKLQYSPSKLVILDVTLVNDSSTEKGFSIYNFMGYGIDQELPMDWPVLAEINPNLTDYGTISLAPGESVSLTFPFALYETMFSRGTWKNFDQYKLFLKVTSSPVTKLIQIQ